MGYHMDMTRREVLVQLDDELVAQLDRIATAHGTSRSELLRRGAAAVIGAESLRLADAELQEAYRSVPQEAAMVVAAQKLAADTIPQW